MLHARPRKWPANQEDGPYRLLSLFFTRRFGHINATAPCVKHARPHTHTHARCRHACIQITQMRPPAGGTPVSCRASQKQVSRHRQHAEAARNLTRLAHPPPGPPTNIVMGHQLSVYTTIVTTIHVYICTYLQAWSPFGASYPTQVHAHHPPLVVARRFEPAACCDPMCLVWVTTYYLPT